MAYSDQQGKVKNWAGSSTVRERFKKEVLPLMEETRSQRAKLNTAWGRYHKAWTKEHEFQAYLGRSNIYLPTTKRGVETLVSQAVAATFPGDEFFVAEPERDEFSAMTADVQALEQNRVEMAKVRMHAEAHYRQLYIKGNAPGRIHWKEKVFSTSNRKKSVKSEEELYGSAESDDAYAYSGPSFTPIPAEDFYAWPPTVNTLEEADGVFEDYITTKLKLQRRASEGFFYKETVEALSGGTNNPDKDNADANRLNSQGITPPQNSQEGEYVHCSHVFLDFDPEAESRDKSKNLRPFHFTVTHDGRVLRAVEAKYTSPGQCHPYVLGRIGQVTGLLWGAGSVEDIFPLQLLLNDQVNQAMDNATWAMNPGIVSNPNVLMTAISEFEPGFQVLATDVNNALKEFRPPDLIQSSSLLMTQTMSWLQEMLGANPVLSGGSTPGRAFRSATGVGVANTNAQLPIQQTVRLQETDVWQPMLKGFWALDKAFAKDEVLIRAGGPNLPPARSVDPKSLYGEYRFRWSASTQMMNVQVRGQQIMQALQVLSNPQTAGMLAQMGMRVNLAPLINRLLRDVFGFRDAEQILIQGPSPMLPGMGPPGMQPGQPQPGQQPAGAPGENPLAGANMEDPSGGFGAVRMEANDLAGAFGQLGPGAPPADDFEEDPIY